MRSNTSIAISQKTRERIKSLGEFGDSYDSVINKFMDAYEQVSEKKNECRSQATTNETGTQPIEVQ
jgi:hypothetical protein